MNEEDKVFPMYRYPDYDGNLTDVIESKFSELTTGVVPNRTEEHVSHTNEGKYENLYIDCRAKTNT